MPKQIEKIQVPPNHENEELKYASKEKIKALIEEYPEAAGATLKQYEEAFSAVLNQLGQDVENGWKDPEVRKMIADALAQIRAGVDPLGKDRDSRMRQQTARVVEACRRKDPSSQRELQKIVAELGITLEKDRSPQKNPLTTAEIKPGDVVSGKPMTAEIKPGDEDRGSDSIMNL